MWGNLSCIYWMLNYSFAPQSTFISSSPRVTHPTCLVPTSSLCRGSPTATRHPIPRRGGVTGDRMRLSQHSYRLHKPQTLAARPWDTTFTVAQQRLLTTGCRDDTGCTGRDPWTCLSPSPSVTSRARHSGHSLPAYESPPSSHCLHHLDLCVSGSEVLKYSSVPWDYFYSKTYSSHSLSRLCVY